MNTIAIGQFYEVGYDMQKPYRISGGLQDNGSWIGPSMALFEWGQMGPGRITNNDWFEVDGSDGYYTVIDPDRPEHRLCRDAGRKPHAPRPAHDTSRGRSGRQEAPGRPALPLPLEHADRHLGP